MHTQIFTILLSFSFFCSIAALLEPVIENVVHLQTALPPPDTPGIWRKKMIWKARWVQEWKTAKTFKPVWRKVWSPVEIREWLPIPRPPPTFGHPSDISSSGGPIFPSQPHPGDVGPHGGPPGPAIIPSHPPPQPPSNPRPPGRPEYQAPGQGPQGSRPPQPPGPSTLLRPIPNEPPSWPNQDNQDLLSSYHTIRETEVETFQNGQKEEPVLFPRYNVGSSDPETLPSFLLPPKNGALTMDYRFNQENKTTPFRPLPIRNEGQAGSSPYAQKLAQAVLREKFNQSLNPTERPSGLTDVIYKPSFSSSTAASPTVRVTKSASQSTTEGPSNVYVVTPLNLV